MIDARELRIGNLVQVKDGTNYDNYVWEASDVSEHGVGVKCEIGYTHKDFEQLKPIPLTEEILLKCGFERKMDCGGGDDFWRGKIINLTLDLELSTSNREYDSQSVDGSQKIKYLHQLQNLCFALTGNELTITL